MPWESYASNIVEGVAEMASEPSTSTDLAGASKANDLKAAISPGSTMEFLANFPVYPFF